MKNPPPIPGSIPVLSCAEAVAFEKSFFADPTHDETAFMARAAKEIAREGENLFAEIRSRPLRSILVLAGKGHNAADALLATSLLREKTAASVTILLAVAEEKLAPATARALQNLLRQGAHLLRWRDATTADIALPENFDLAIDGLLGHQFSPPLRSPFADLLRWANAQTLAKIRLAVDLPSGLGDASQPEDLIFSSDATVACGLVKTPLLSLAGEKHRGRLRLACIGFPNTLPGEIRAGGSGLFSLGQLRQLRPPRADKRDFGHLFILGGSRIMPGALLMNVQAALQAGAGLVTVFCPESVHATFAAAAPEAMWIPWPETPNGALALEGEFLLREKISRATALLCGSGMSDEPETQALLQSVATHCPVPLILDADALRPEIVEAAAQRKSPLPTVLLPHAGELARLTSNGEFLRATATRLRACIARKGAPTTVADAQREITVCTGGPILARGGSGDLLAGITGALFARQISSDPLQTLATAVAWHGAAADLAARRHGAEALTTTALLPHLSSALRA